MINIQNNNTVNNNKPAPASFLTSVKKTLNNKTFQATLGAATVAAAAATAYYFTRSTPTTQPALPCEGMSPANHTLYPSYAAKPTYNLHTTLNNNSTALFNNATNLTSITNITLNPTPTATLSTTTFNRNLTAQLLDPINSNALNTTKLMQDRPEPCQGMSLANHTFANISNSATNFSSINNTTVNNALRATKPLQYATKTNPVISTLKNMTHFLQCDASLPCEGMSVEVNGTKDVFYERYTKPLIDRLASQLQEIASINLPSTSDIYQFVTNYYLEDSDKCQTKQQKEFAQFLSNLNKKDEQQCSEAPSTLLEQADQSVRSAFKQIKLVLNDIDIEEAKRNFYDNFVINVAKEAASALETNPYPAYSSMERFGNFAIESASKLTKKALEILNATSSIALYNLEPIASAFLETFNQNSKTNIERIQAAKNRKAAAQQAKTKTNHKK